MLEKAVEEIQKDIDEDNDKEKAKKYKKIKIVYHRNTSISF